MIRNRVLVVEDDESMQELYESLFAANRTDFLWVLAKSGESALQVIGRHPSPPIDAVVLDWNLPGVDGAAILKTIRSNRATRFIPVVMVTGRDSGSERVLGIQSGADDYLVKPVSQKELLARLRGLLRRREWGLEEHRAFELEGLRLEATSGCLEVDGVPNDLHPKEAGLLEIFLRRPNVIHDSLYLWEAVWGYPSSTWRHVLTETLRTLRDKLGPKWGERLETHRGRGYLFNTCVSSLHP